MILAPEHSGKCLTVSARKYYVFKSEHLGLDSLQIILQHWLQVLYCREGRSGYPYIAQLLCLHWIFLRNSSHNLIPPCSSVGEASALRAADLGSIPVFAVDYFPGKRRNFTSSGEPCRSRPNCHCSRPSCHSNLRHPLIKFPSAWRWVRPSLVTSRCETHQRTGPPNSLHSQW